MRLITIFFLALALAGCAAPAATEDPRPQHQAKQKAKIIAPQQTVAEGKILAPPKAIERTVRKATKKPRTKQQEQIASGPQSFFYGRTLANYKGPMEQAWTGWNKARGENKKYISYIIDQPKTAWMGAWIKDGDIYNKTKSYIENSQAGDPKKVVSIASFRLVPWYTGARNGNPSRAAQESYKHWVREQARAIGSTPAIVVLQPDMPFLMTARHRATYTALLRFAAAEYAKNENTRLYLEAGAWDWPAPGQGGAPAAVDFLKEVGMEHVDGVALNSTHYSSVELEIQRSKELIELLHQAGYKQELKSVINTATSGNPWEFGKFQFKGIADEAPACTSPKQFGNTTCVSLGIPPTFDVGNPRWQLSEAARRDALKYVDGFLWFGRPWLHMQASPFLEQKAADLVKYSPFYSG